MIFDEKELDYFFNHYLDFFKVLNDFANPSNYIIIFHEDLSAKTFCRVAEKLNFKIKKNIKEIDYSIYPGGYRKKFSFFKRKVVKYDKNSLESKLVEDKYG